MNKNLTFSDPKDWLKTVKAEVQKSYIIPKEINRNICLDLGVNVGAFTLVNHRNFKRIIGIEASRLNFKTALDNIHKNDVRNFKLHHFAIGKESNKTLRLRSVEVRINGENVVGTGRSGDCTVLDLSNSEMEAAGFNHGLSKEYEEVQSIDFVDTLLLVKSANINYIKCDVEGSEYDFFIDHDLKCVDFLSMELHYTALGRGKVISLMNHLNKFFDFYDGYKITDYVNVWPPPSMVNMINKNIHIKNKFMRRCIRLIKNKIRMFITS